MVSTTPGEVTVRVTAHGYTLECHFRFAGSGSVEALFRGPFDPAEERVRIENGPPLGPVLAHLAEQEYRMESRQDVGRDAALIIQTPDAHHSLAFHRSTVVRSPDPVNDLIDWCARHAPLLVEDG